MTPNPTFATLRALHAIMGDALDDIHRIFSNSFTPHSSQCSSPAFPDSPEPVSVPATPMSSTFSTHTSSYGTPLSPVSNLQHDYPSPSLPYVASSQAEQLAACPAATAAATRIIAAAGQIASIVQKPFLFMSDASMVYTLPACLRLIEHLHIVEILRDAEDDRQRLLSELRIIAELQSQSEPVIGDQSALGNGSKDSVKGLASHPSFTRDAPTKAEEKALQLEGVHVKDISRIITERTGGIRCVDSVRLAHPLRLLSTHHILRETAPDTFALTRVASLLDSGKSVADVFAHPEKKYEDTSGIAAFVGMCTDELFKSAAYLTEAFTGVQLPSAPPGSAPSMPIDGNDAHISALRTQHTGDDAHISGFPASRAHISSPLAQLHHARSQSFTSLHSDHPSNTTSSTQTHPYLPEHATVPHALSPVAEQSTSHCLWDATMPAPIPGPPLGLGSGLLSPKRGTTPHTETSSVIASLTLPPHPSPLHNTTNSKSGVPDTPSALLSKCASLVSTLTLASTNSGVVSDGRPPSSDVGLSSETDRRSAGSGVDPEPLPAFNLAFNTPVPFFEWLEDGGLDALGGNGVVVSCVPAGTVGNPVPAEDEGARSRVGHARNISTSAQSGRELRKSFRLERFSQAMIGTSGWEAPGAILTGFDWLSLPRGSTIVDVGGGIGSTTMILARAFGGSSGRRGSVSSDEAEDTIENNSFTPQRSSNDLVPRKSRSDLKSFASRGDLKSHTSRADLKPANLKPARSHADLKPQSSQGELDARQSLVACEDQDMQFRFIIQDRPVVVGLGLDAWRAQCPEMLESGQVVFYDHDFFLPQPSLPSSDLNRHPAVYLLRVVLHDWPDARARHVLLNLRLGSSPETRLIIADHVLPLACVDEGVRSAKHEHQKSEGEKWTLDSVLAHLEGAHGTLAPVPLLPNLGKASATPFSMDIVMHIIFNGKERTLREFCALALSSGWRVARVTYSKGSHFGHLVCEPVDIPEDAFTILPGRPISDPAIDLSFECAEPSEDDEHEGPQTAQEMYANKLPSSLGSRPISTVLPLLPSPILERSSSRCGTPTFGSRVFLPGPDEIPSGKSKSYSLGRRWLKARGLGVRSVVEKQKRREEGARKADEHDDQSGQCVSPQHSRVWWKRAPPASPVAEEGSSDSSMPRSPLRLRRGTITTPEFSPPLPLQSPGIPTQYSFPAHRTTPSVQSNFQSDGSSSAPRSRRPSVASLTRKLNFSPFARRPSLVDGVTQRGSDASASPLSASFDPAYVQSADQEKKLRHQPSSPMMQKYHPDGDREHSVRHHPSAPHLKGRSTRAEEPPPLPTTPKVIRDDGSSSAPRKSGLLSSPMFSASRSSLSTTNSRQPSHSILSGAPALIRAPSTPAEPTSPKPKRQPSTPKLPRRISIPILRRKRGQSLSAERDT